MHVLTHACMHAQRNIRGLSVVKCYDLRMKRWISERACTALSDGLSSVPSSPVGQLTTASGSEVRNDC